MNNLSIVLLIVWAVLAIVNIVGIFVPVHLIFAIMFGLMNMMIMISLVPLIYDHIKISKSKKNELQLQK